MLTSRHNKQTKEHSRGRWLEAIVRQHALGRRRVLAVEIVQEHLVAGRVGSTGQESQFAGGRHDEAPALARVVHLLHQRQELHSAVDAERARSDRRDGPGQVRREVWPLADAEGLGRRRLAPAAFYLFLVALAGGSPPVSSDAIQDV